MTLKHVSAYLYGIGAGVVLSFTLLGQYSYLVWSSVAVLFTAAYLADKRSDHDD